MYDETSKGEMTRQRILDSALKRFIDNGYHATTTRQITNDLGMAAGSIYNHFSGKEEIFVAVLKTYHPWLFIPIALESADGMNLEEYVRQTATLLKREWDSHPGIIRLHLIEWIEFKGIHLAPLFETTFTRTTAIAHRWIERRQVQACTGDAVWRALLGLFFAYLFAEDIGAGEAGNAAGISYGYFVDSYLYGALSPILRGAEKTKEE